MDQDPEASETGDRDDGTPADTEAEEAKQDALEQSVDPATWRKGGVGVDP
jgi:hypothetical protein